MRSARKQTTADRLFPRRTRSHRRRVRALADEDIDPIVVAGLRSEGWDVLAVAEYTKLQGTSDEELHRVAAKQKRLLVTADGDYQDDRKFPLQGGPGVLILAGHDARTQWEAVRRAGPWIQQAVDLEPSALSWSKYTESSTKLRCRGRMQSGELFDDVIWEATPAARKGKGTT
jgi:predicted nuclease of predicted toxin-antitoxin system